MNTETPVTEAEIAMLVDRFYAKVREDPEIGPVFNDAVQNWDAHLALLKDFWSTVLLATGRYKGNPLLAHFRLPIEAEYFARWLTLFAETANEVMSAPHAELVVRKANLISVNMKRVFAFGTAAPGTGLEPATKFKNPETGSNKRKAGRMTTEGFADDGTMLKDFAQFNLTQEILDSEQKRPWPMGHFARTLFKKTDFRMVLISMEKGSILKKHHADGTISVQLLKGSIRFIAKGEAHALQPNSVVTLSASIEHEVEALEESAFLLTIAWPIAEKLQKMKHRGYGS